MLHIYLFTVGVLFSVLLLHTFGNTNYFYNLPLQIELTKSTAYNSLVPLSREIKRYGKKGRYVVAAVVLVVMGPMRMEMED